MDGVRRVREGREVTAAEFGPDDAHAQEHEIDPLDVADAWALLDGGQVLAAVEPLDHDAEDQEFMLHRRHYDHHPLTRDR